MKKITNASMIVLLATLFNCTEKDPGPNTSEDEKPQPTMVGFPIGASVTKTIGPAGGSIAIDGQVEILIPAGALNEDTDISVTPLTNNAPNGNGNAYRFGPEGTKFNKPVRVTFPYLATDNSQPVVTGIAYQDSDGIWYSTGKFTWDTVNKKVSTETLHFSDWATFDHIALRCDNCGNRAEQQTAKIDQQVELVLYVLARETLTSGDGETVPLVKSEKYAWSLIVKEWFANGEKATDMGPFGKLTPNDDGSTYVAPASAPANDKNPVNISVTLKDLLYKDPVTKKDFKDLQLFLSIEIIGLFKYDVSVKYYSDDLFQGGLLGTTFIVRDSMDFRLVINESEVTCSGFTNANGVVVPTTMRDAFNNKSTWLPDGFFGPLNVTEGTGFIADHADGTRTLLLTLSGTTISPAFEWVAFSGEKQTFASQTGPTLNLFYFDMVTDSIPISTGPTGSFTIKMTAVE